MRVEEGGISSIKVRRETEVDTGRWAVTSTFVGSFVVVTCIVS